MRSDSWRTVLRFLDQIKISIKISMHCLFKGSQEQFFFLQTLLFTAFLATVLKILTYAFVSTWSLVSSAWEHVKRKMHSWYPCASMSQLLSYLEGLGRVIFKCLNNIYVLSFSTSLSCFQYIRGEHENARFKEMMKVASFPSPLGIPLTLRTKCKLLSFFKFTFPNISESKVLFDSQKYSSECAF